jgi:hypothetical protein
MLVPGTQGNASKNALGFGFKFGFGLRLRDAKASIFYAKKLRTGERRDQSVNTEVKDQSENEDAKVPIRK